MIALLTNYNARRRIELRFDDHYICGMCAELQESYFVTTLANKYRLKMLLSGTRYTHNFGVKEA